MSKLHTDSMLQMYYHRQVCWRPRGKHFSKDSFERTFCDIFHTKAGPKINLVTSAKDVLADSRCDFILEDYVGFSNGALPPHASGSGLQGAVAGCHSLPSPGDARGDAGLVPVGWSWYSWLCFTYSLPKHVTSPH